MTSSDSERTTWVMARSTSYQTQDFADSGATPTGPPAVRPVIITAVSGAVSAICAQVTTGRAPIRRHRTLARQSRPAQSIAAPYSSVMSTVTTPA